MLIGIEIEGYINKSIDIEIAEYHSGKFNTYKYIKFEKDETLTSKIGTPAEAVSNILHNEKELNLMLEEIKSALKINSEEENVILIDGTCGCHIHFSHETKRDYIFLDKLYKIKRMHENFLKRYDYQQYKAFKNQYYRKHAKEVLDIEGEERDKEIIDTIRKGLEWRSFNLQGIRNFKDIRARLTNIFKLIQKYYNDEETKYPNKLFERNYKEVISLYEETISNENILLQQEKIQAAFNNAMKEYEINENVLEFELNLEKEEEENFVEEEIEITINKKQKRNFVCALSL